MVDREIRRSIFWIRGFLGSAVLTSSIRETAIWLEGWKERIAPRLEPFVKSSSIEIGGGDLNL